MGETTSDHRIEALYRDVECDGEIHTVNWGGCGRQRAPLDISDDDVDRMLQEAIENSMESRERKARDGT